MLTLLNRALLTAALLAPLQACVFFGDKPPEYVESRDGEPVRVPEDLDEPVYRSPIAIVHPEMRMPTGDELNPGPPSAVTATGGRTDTNAYMAWSAEGVYLLVKDTPDSVQRRLGFAIDRTGMNRLDGDSDGLHRFEYVHLVPDDRSLWQKMAFWRGNDGPNFTGIYRTRVEADGENSRVYLLFDTGESATTDAAEHILAIFMERLA